MGRPAVSTVLAFAFAASAIVPTRAHATTESPSGLAGEPEEAGFYRDCRANGWPCCVPDESPCIRPGPARLLLAAAGIAAGALGAALLLVVGERIGSRDPAGLLIGSGGVALGGSILGAFSALTMGDAPAHPDRIGVPTFDLELTSGDMQPVDENHPPTLRFRFAPTWRFPDGSGRLRLFGHVGGLLGEEVDVDPRPQGGFQTGLVEKRQSFAVGFDMAFALPYPLLKPRFSRFLGPVELRFKPEVQIRRHIYQPGSDAERVVERAMLLPLTVGIRWWLSQRQRFTFYIGPRFDFLAHSDPDEDGLSRGSTPQTGPVYGEAWYEVEVPFNLISRGGRLRRLAMNGLLRLGYVHSRFDGLGFNIRGAIGFTGPIHASWHMRFRPIGAKWALQAGLGTWIGNGVSPFFTLGMVVPDIGRSRR